MKFKLVNDLYERYSLKKSERIEYYYVPELQSLLKEIQSEQRRGWKGFASRYNRVKVVVKASPQDVYTIGGVEFAPTASLPDKPTNEDELVKFNTDNVGKDLHIRLLLHSEKDFYTIVSETNVAIWSFLKGYLEVGEVYEDNRTLRQSTEAFQHLVDLYEESIESVEKENEFRELNPEEKSLYRARKKMSEATKFPVDDELFEWIDAHVIFSKVYVRKGLEKDLDNYFPGITRSQYDLWEDDHYSWTAQFDFDTINGCPNSEIRDLYERGKGHVFSINLALTLYNERGFKFERRAYKRDLKNK